jgi:6,7-dimethyl-8-ribityllumazine synthase
VSGPKTIEGKLDATGLRVALVAARFNGFIVDQLISGAVGALRRAGANEDDVTVFWAPGSWEIPQVAARVLEAGGFDALVALGCVIRGGTPHFEYVADRVAKGLADLAQRAAIPVTFGVLTTDTIEQAIERAGTKAGNKGADAALAAVEMVGLFRAVQGKNGR